MPGIIGLINKAGEGLPSIEPMLDAMTTQHQYKTERFEKNPTQIGLAHLSDNKNNQGIYTSIDSNVTIILFGEIYQFDEVEKLFNQKEALDSIYQAYKRYGDSFVTHFEGEFTITIIDQIRNKVMIVADRFGRRPCYYSKVNAAIIFASEIKAILAYDAYSPSINYEAVADFLTFGYILGEKTLLSNIELLPPASTLIINTNDLTYTISPYWQLNQHLQQSELSDEESTEQIVNAFAKAANKRLSHQETNYISLSGGMDSRALAAVIDPGKNPIETVTSGLNGGYEKVITKKISSLIGCEHLFYEFDEQSMTNSHEDIIDLIHHSLVSNDGMRGTSSSAMTAYSAMQRKNHNLRHVITGHGGEIAKLDKAYSFSIRSDQDLSELSTNPTDWAFKRMANPQRPEEVKNLFINELSGAYMDSPKANLSSSLQSIPKDTKPAQTVSWLFLNELFRKRAVYALMTHRTYTNIRLPFYDDTFISSVISAPYHLRRKYNIHREIITRYKPELLNIKLSDTRMRPFPNQYDYLFSGLAYNLGKRLGMYKRDHPEDFFESATNADFFRKTLLNERSLDRQLLDRTTLQMLIQNYSKGQQRAYNLLHLLTLIELWFQEYIDHE
ncbi:MAG TPA: hypothetical protein ENH82_19940 [bacterium]|nr:hypothetical protein [bacterium]